MVREMILVFTKLSAKVLHNLPSKEYKNIIHTKNNAYTHI
jgi:hypothetical protein